MADTIHCPHCSAAVPPSELADGWCDSCGKKLPTSVGAKKAAMEAANAAPAPGGSSRWMWAALPVVGVVAAVLYFAR